MLSEAMKAEALEALSKKATQGLLIVPERDAHTDRTSAHVSNNLPSVFVACAGKPIEQREADTLFIASLWNAYRTGQLILAQPSGDEVEAVASLVAAATAVRNACLGTPVGGGDGGTYVPGNPTATELNNLTAAITALDAHRGKQCPTRDRRWRRRSRRSLALQIGATASTIGSPSL